MAAMISTIRSWLIQRFKQVSDVFVPPVSPPVSFVEQPLKEEFLLKLVNAAADRQAKYHDMVWELRELVMPNRNGKKGLTEEQRLILFGKIQDLKYALAGSPFDWDVRQLYGFPDHDPRPLPELDPSK